MVSRAGEHQATVQIRFETLELRGGSADGKRDPLKFVGRRVEVVDVDASGPDPVWLKPVDLDHTHIAMQHGLDPSESDPQFHQQMVYAVAMRTLEQFDRALGRVVHFKGRRRLRLVPHAFRGGNAFYDRDMRAVLFGYFRASKDAPGDNLPGQIIFTCLSHDIIAHEVTHAVVDRLRPNFNVATSPQVRAFHEGFADIVAIFQRLSFRDLVHRALQDARGDVRQSLLLSNIAAQFGQGLGSGKALRSALDSNTKVQDVPSEEHALGAVLVAAIFEGFYTTYERRTADLLRIATGGTGELPRGALHPDLVSRLTAECVRTAQAVLTMCIRAFDYLPPTDVTFGAFLRALVTADWELNPLDEVGLRAALIEACRRRGIFATEAGSLAVDALLLDPASNSAWSAHVEEFKQWVDLAIRKDIEEQRADTPEEPDADEPDASAPPGLEQQTSMVQPDAAEPEEDLDSAKKLDEAIRTWFNGLSPAERQQLGFSPHAPLKYPHFHSSRRVTAHGTVRFGLVVQLIQMQKVVSGAGPKDGFPWGATLVIDVSGDVRFVIAAPSISSRTAEIEQMQSTAMTNTLGWKLAAPAADPFAVSYRGMHEART
ncbi:MAG TPA: hypothetical protein VFP80_06080 [Thermoanaerobaculia bacterium]|nr:hypothetical protein [Thermoanaerobaculia bacterium]